MDKTRGNLPLTITWGALWGLLEATAGWGMHVWHLPYKSLLLFPIGAACMLTGVYRAGRSGTALEIAAVAALIKLTNLFMPGYFPIYYVVNPAVAIALEGAAVCLFCRMFARAGSRGSVSSYVSRWLAASGLLLAAFFLFWGWQEILSARTVLNPATEKGFAGASPGTVLIECLLKGGMLVGLARALKPSVAKKPFASPNFSPLLQFPALPRPVAGLSSSVSPLASRCRWIWAVSLFLVAILLNHFAL